MASASRSSARIYARGRRARYQPVSTINVTPLVDVMLVLLIVFMVTAPLLNVGVPVNLPETRAATVSGVDEPVVLTVNEQGEVYLQETAVTPAQLAAHLKDLAARNPDLRVFVRGDNRVSYGVVMQVMGQVSAAGFDKVSLIARLPE